MLTPNKFCMCVTLTRGTLILNQCNAMTEQMDLICQLHAKAIELNISLIPTELKLKLGVDLKLEQCSLLNSSVLLTYG